MKKYLAILVVLSLLITLFLGGTFEASTASAQDGKSSNKISSLLSLQVEAKLRAQRAAPMEEGRVDILQAMQERGAAVTPLNEQRIFIHSAEELSQSQIEELQAMGLTLYPDSWIPAVGTHPTGFILAEMLVDKLEELAGKNYIMMLDTAERFLEAHNDLATQKINADDVWSANYTGANVTIAVLDSGLDVNHNDIPTPTASKDYSNYPTSLDDTIESHVTGHGTHVTGSALGRGTQSSGVYKGSAPGADLTFLKIGLDSDGRFATTAAMAGAIKAAVDTYNADIITMSYGGWDSYHDGTSQEAQAVDYAVSQGAVVFISAGNEADDDQHYSGNVSANSTSGYIQVNVTGAGTNDTLLWFNLVWYDGTGTHNDLALEYYDDSHTLLSDTTHGTQSESSRGTESELSYYNPWVPPGNSTYYLKVKNNSTNSQFFHIYVWYAGAGSVKFNSPDPDYTLTSPADADSAVAVGAYTTRTSWYDYNNDGPWQLGSGQTLDQICTFSSRGPRVDTGASLKPNIVAPGAYIISCRDDDVYTWANRNPRYIDNDGPNTDNATKNDGAGPADYYVMQGTSMASPHAAGVAALLLDKNPTWTPAQVKQAIESTAADKGAGGHDNVYGWGLIDALAALGYDAMPPTMETILESQGHYYNTAPILSNFGFDDNVALNDGWYQMDSYTGSWTALFTDNLSTSWDSDNWTIPGFVGLAEGSHTIYFKGSDNTSNVEGESGEWSWQFYKDITPPTDPTSVNSTSHTISVWSSDNTVGVNWTDATDNLSGIDGYSILWDTDNSTIPDQIKDIEEGSENTTSPELADGNSHYFHIRSKDNAGNWQSTVHLGPFYIETVPPTDPTGVSSTSHTISVWSSDNTVSVNWTDATDNLSGLDGYSILWDTDNSTIPDTIKDIEEGSENTTSPALADGNSHYFHIRSKDNAGNWQSTVHLGPFYIDTTPPTMEAIVEAEGQYYNTAPTFSNFGFDDNGLLDDGWYQIDSYTGNWTVLFTDNASASWDSDNWTISEFGTLAEGSHTIYFKASDNVSNVEGESGEWSWQFYKDTVSPAAVTDLAASNPTHNSIRLTWTAPGNDGNIGTAATYDIRYSTSNITSANWTSATQCTGEPAPSSANTTETFTVAGLSDSTTYYFALKTADSASNWSTLSNIASGNTTVAPPPAPPPAGGGGGGGGGGAAGVTPVLNVVTEKGRFTEDVTAKSEDRKVELYIPKDTIGLNRVGQLITSIRIKKEEEPPAIPADSEVIGLFYQIGPEGATFNPPIDLTIKYDESKIPEGVAEKNLVVATFDRSTDQWVELESTVDPENDTVTAKVSHFSAFTILVYTRPASFTVADLTITPDEVDLGESVSISVLVTNTGDLIGGYEVSLKIDDMVTQTKEVTFDGGDSETISFSMTPDTAGEYTVSIGDLLGTCKVKAPKAPAAFTSSTLTISPVEVNIEESVTISVTLANTGDLTGTHEVSLKINGIRVQTKEVTLDGGESQEVVFTTAKDTVGTYAVDVDGLTGSFVVKEEAPLVAEEEISIIPAPAVTPAPIPTPEPTPTAAPEFKWWLISGIIAGLVVAGLVSYFLVRKRRKAKGSAQTLN